MTHAAMCTGVAFWLQPQSTLHWQPPRTGALTSDPRADPDLLVVQIHHPPSDRVFQFHSNVHIGSDSSTSATQRNVWRRGGACTSNCATIARSFVAHTEMAHYCLLT